MTEQLTEQELMMWRIAAADAAYCIKTGKKALDPDRVEFIAQHLMGSQFPPVPSAVPDSGEKGEREEWKS